MQIREPETGQLDEINVMIMRSKAHWGYDDVFLERCRNELTFDKARLRSEFVRISYLNTAITGIAELEFEQEEAGLSKMFVDPSAIGTGAGRLLFDWAVQCARQNQAKVLRIESDPYAQGFYEHMGARLVGNVPSGSIPGRQLPLLLLEL